MANVKEKNLSHISINETFSRWFPSKYNFFSIVNFIATPYFLSIPYSWYFQIAAKINAAGSPPDRGVKRELEDGFRKCTDF